MAIAKRNGTDAKATAMGAEPLPAACADHAVRMEIALAMADASIAADTTTRVQEVCRAQSMWGII
jgi:hypothetical protein